MIDLYVILTPVLLLAVVALLQFVGCSFCGIATPTFDPPPGTFGAPQQVTISAAGTIYYTTDGTNPKTSGSRQTYAGPILVSTTTLIRTYFRDDGCDSSVVDASFTISPIAEVVNQRGKGQVNDGVSATAAFPNPVTAGNLLVVAGALWRDMGGTTITTIQDTLGTTYLPMPSDPPLEVVSGDGNYRIFIAYGLAPSSGANSVTVTTAAQAFTSFGIDEFTGIDTSDPLYTDSGGVSSGGPSTTPSASIVTGPNALIVGTMTFEAGQLITINPDTSMGYTQIEEEEDASPGGGNHTSFNAQFKVVPNLGTFPVSWTLSIASLWNLYRVSFRGWPI